MKEAGERVMVAEGVKPEAEDVVAEYDRVAAGCVAEEDNVVVVESVAVAENVEVVEENVLAAEDGVFWVL